ncbi:unnamed protein product [Leptosia nina]|uniref:Uncharacterized protein n=1 Tax=Leptosia nina TaxID=320188 RepID=A0AAV1J782_9NEOP
MRRSLSQIQESGGGCGGGGGGGAKAGSVLRLRTFARFLSIVACGMRATEPGRRHGPAAGPAPDPRLLFFSIVACRSHTPVRHSLLLPYTYLRATLLTTHSAYGGLPLPTIPLIALVRASCSR